MKRFFRSLQSLLLALAALALAPGVHADSVLSAQAPVRAAGKALHLEALRLAPGSAPVSVVRLGEADAAQIDEVRRANSDPKNKRLQIGIGRDVPAGSDAGSDSLAWKAVPGGQAAHWQVTSLGAHALRVGLEVTRLAPGTEISFAGQGGSGTIYGPFTAEQVTFGRNLWWSPVLEGDSAVVEVFVPEGAKRSEAQLAIASLSHLFASPSDARAESLAKDSQFCEVDFICRAANDSALALVGKAVARMTFTDGAGSGTFLCTGTLLNTTSSSFIPYFYSANHCISTQAAASTLTTHWFYDRTGCGFGGTSSSYVQLPGGATLLYADTATDVLFLQLNQNPPNGAIYAGWNANALSTGTSLTAVHHPAGDLKKVSLATHGGFSGYNAAPGDGFIVSLWNSTSTGVTEGGSSGSGIFSAVGSPVTDYQLRGGLYGGPSSCTATGVDLRDYYSRFDRAYATRLSQYLAGSTPATANYTATWWDPTQNGWGLNVAHQGSTIFATLYTYAGDNAGLWLVGAALRLQGDGSYSGALYQAVGPPYYSQPWGAVTLTQVGTMTLRFSSTSAGTLTYTVNGASVTKSIQPYVFVGGSVPSCTPGTGSRASLTNYQDIWWNAAESGWGLALAHQGNIIFATLYNYGNSGRDVWLVASALNRQSDGSFTGDLLLTSGPVFNASPWTGISATSVGSMTLRFNNGESGTLSYTVLGTNVVKSITRYTFDSPVPFCR